MPKNLTDFRVVFMGTSTFADVLLNSLLEEKYNIVGIYTQPDKKTGRNRIFSKSAVKITAEKNNLDIFQPERLDESSIETLRQLKPALIIVAAYGKILPRKILDIPKFGCINVHASLLPKYRGPSPIQNALLNGEKETGSTIMLMDAGIDTGDILSQEKIIIRPDETFPELMGRLAGISSSLLLETLPKWTEGRVKPIHQDNSRASLCRLIEKNDGHILWSDNALIIYNIYRALYSWPGIFSYWERGTERVRIKLNKIGILETDKTESHHLGEVMELPDGKIGVQTAKGIVILEEIQLEGKKNMKVESFINGYPDFAGSILK
jgi:methionyl-tRNA formyltransferase